MKMETARECLSSVGGTEVLVPTEHQGTRMLNKGSFLKGISTPKLRVDIVNDLVTFWLSAVTDLTQNAYLRLFPS